MASSNDSDQELAAFRALLQRTDVDPMQLRDTMPPSAAAELAQWVEAHPDLVAPYGARHLLDAVPLEHWSDDLLYSELTCATTDTLADGFEPLLAEFEKRAPSDPRLPDLYRRADATPKQPQIHADEEE